MIEEKIAEIDNLLIEALRAAEMRQGCTNHSYYADILKGQILETLASGGLEEEERKQFHESVYKIIRQDIVGHTATEKKVAGIEVAAKDLFNALAIRTRAQCEKEIGGIFEEIRQWAVKQREGLYIKKQKQMAIKPMDKQAVAQLGGKLKALQGVIDECQALKKRGGV